MSPETPTLVTEVLLVSRYPFIIRMLPGVSVMAVLQTLLDDQVTAAPVVACVSSISADAAPLTPVALFQFAFAITPALSVRKASFAFKAEVTIVDGASVQRVVKPGNPLTVLVTTTIPLPVKILELYVRLGRVGEFQMNVIKGADAIKAYLLKS
jgi:hypothetical protein